MGTGFVISIIVIIIAGGFLYRSMQRRGGNNKLPKDTRRLLTENVAFYNKLDDKGKALFEARVNDFIAHVSIRGVDVIIEDLDHVLVAAGAIIPIFAFPDWRYNNISEVLLYKDTFNKDFSADGGERNVLGMVGDGAMHREMILSKPALRASFRNPADGHNTAIHEFAHLIDKADSETDGVPEYLLANPSIAPWVKIMHETINDMKKKNHSDIDLYGATNDAEFFAVVSEYFFEKPGELKEHHPELYGMLEQMFHTKG